MLNYLQFLGYNRLKIPILTSRNISVNIIILFNFRYKSVSTTVIIGNIRYICIQIDLRL